MGGKAGAILSDRPPGQDDPHLGPRVPGTAAIVAQGRGYLEARFREAAGHLRNGQRSERQRKHLRCLVMPASLREFLLEGREMTSAVLLHGFDERDVGTAFALLPALQTDP